MENQEKEQDPNSESQNPFMGNYIKALTPDASLIEKYNNQYIYSENNFQPYSFCTGHKHWGFDKNGFLTSPSPTILKTSEYQKKPDLTKEGVLKGQIIDETKGLVLVDPFICKKFGGIIKDFLASLLILATGKKVSLKVRLFEPKSVLQRVPEYWSTLPSFLTPTYNKEMNPIERMKYIMTLAISGLYLTTNQLKPFNPLICETFEGEFQDDPYHTKVYCEQTSNYPTISRFYLVNSEIKLHGYVDLSTKVEKFGMNLSLLTKGYVNVEYTKFDELITYIFPTVKMLNVITQTGRSCYYKDNLIFVDKKNKLKGIIQLGIDYYHITNFKGYIMEMEYEENYTINYDKEQYWGYYFKPDKYRILERCEGSWLKEIKFGDKVYWDIDKDIPNWIRPVDNPLPSDGRYREDLIWLFRSFYLSNDQEETQKYEDLAQCWKLMVEKLQREEREMKARKNKKKKGGLLGLGLGII